MGILISCIALVHALLGLAYTKTPSLVELDWPVLSYLDFWISASMLCVNEGRCSGWEGRPLLSKYETPHLRPPVGVKEISTNKAKCIRFMTSPSRASIYRKKVATKPKENCPLYFHQPSNQSSRSPSDHKSQTNISACWASSKIFPIQLQSFLIAT